MPAVGTLRRTETVLAALSAAVARAAFFVCAVRDAAARVAATDVRAATTRPVLLLRAEIVRDEDELFDTPRDDAMRAPAFRGLTAVFFTGAAGKTSTTSSATASSATSSASMSVSAYSITSS